MGWDRCGSSMALTRKILIVDDDGQNRQLLVEALAQEPYELETAETGELACQKAGEQEFSIVISDIQMGATSGLDVLKWFRVNAPDTPVVLLTAFGSVKTAIQAMKTGAFDYLTKPIDLKELLMIVDRGIEHHRLIRENRELRMAFNQRIRAVSIVGQSRSMVEIFKVVGKVARTRASVLIYGETGTGKELVARAIHDSSDRGGRPFVAINCSALPDALFESELFGHIQGAFTNADKLRRGLIEESSGGTLFLDEISDLSPAGQAKLLRVLQEGEIRRVGANTTITVDLRIVAASRYDLQQLVKEGRFREDLLYRLKTVTITIPPLRERREEIHLLADLFLARYSIDGNATVLLPSALDVLIKYDWPGNVRELEHIIERAATLAVHPILSAEDLPKEIQDQVVSGSHSRSSPLAAARRKVGSVTKQEVSAAFEITRGNKLHMAELLGLSRWAVYRLLQKYEIGEKPTAEQD